MASSSSEDRHEPFDQDTAKRAAAQRALDFVTPHMRLGLGTGSTATAFVELLGQRVAEGLEIIGVPTSERTAALARRLNIRLATLDEEPDLDLTIDGADEYDSSLRLIKGGGGALLREKITASASKRMIVIADKSKEVAVLGQFPLPVEVNAFGLAVTRAAVIREAARCGCEGELVLRRGPDERDYVTDGGHFLFDCHFGRIPAPEELAARLNAIPGVVEHGLFIGFASAVITASPEGVTILGHPEIK